MSAKPILKPMVSVTIPDNPRRSLDGARFVPACAPNGPIPTETKFIPVDGSPISFRTLRGVDQYRQVFKIHDKFGQRHWIHFKTNWRAANVERQHRDLVVGDNEGCPLDGINPQKLITLRELTAQIKQRQSGFDGDGGGHQQSGLVVIGDGPYHNLATMLLDARFFAAHVADQIAVRSILLSALLTLARGARQ